VPVRLMQRDPRWLIRLEGLIGVACAGELKDLLVEWRTAGKDLELDLESVQEIDITILQLLHAATREGERSGAQIVGRASADVMFLVRQSGFDQIPGFLFRE